MYVDSEYTWKLLQEKNCRRFRLLFPLSVIGQCVYSVVGEDIGHRGAEGEISLFSPLQFLLYQST